MAARIMVRSNGRKSAFASEIRAFCDDMLTGSGRESGKFADSATAVRKLVGHELHKFSRIDEVGGVLLIP